MNATKKQLTRACVKIWPLVTVYSLENSLENSDSVVDGLEMLAVLSTCSVELDIVTKDDGDIGIESKLVDEYWMRPEGVSVERVVNELQLKKKFEHVYI